MPVSITMPQLGESVTEGTVTRWLKNVGDTVAMDEPLLEISTDKVDTEIPSPVAGVLLEIRAVEDDVVKVGGELAVVGEVAEATATPATPAPVPAVKSTIEVPQAAPATAPAPASASPSATPVTLPALGESVTEGTVIRWLKSVGDDVAIDEPLLEVSTDKVDTEIPSPVAGVLTEISVAQDETVEVGATLGIIGAVGAISAANEAPEPIPPVVPQTPAETISANITVDNSAAALAATSTAYASPIARKLARESGVDIATVAPSAADGRISKQDIRDAAATAGGPPATVAQVAATPPPPAATPSRPDSPERGRTEPMTRLRRVIAERMVDSLHVSAQLTTVVEVDVTRIAALRTRAKEAFLAREGISLSFLPFFARATLEALKQYPNVNASVDSDAHTVTYHDSTHLGIAVDTDRGLLVPVVRDAGDLTLSGLARRIADLAERTRTSKVGPDELSGGTFTLTNTGSRGALFDTPIINQPQVGILGTGAVVKRPIVVSEPHGEDAIAIRSMVYFALTYDHRIVDGANAARFLGAIKARLESADFEAELGL